jgi:predicted ATPase/DNA-binding SARP family transcriptional activator
MRYRLLGSLTVERDDGTTVDIPAPKRRALLAILLLQRGRPIGRDALIDALWGESAPESAVNSLFAHASRLRDELGKDAIRTVPGGYALPLADGKLDIVVAEREVAAGRRALGMGHAPAASVLLSQALARWAGPALAEFRDEAFAQPEIANLEQLQLGALEDRIEADLALRRHHDLVPELEQLVRVHPLRERMWSQLMLALYRSGRQVDALARYAELRRSLVAELGLDPGPELQDLQRRILGQDPGLVPPAGDGPLVDLPPVPTRTFGRQAVIGLAGDILASHRLLTLTGPGGVGKTRLAILVATGLAAQHPDGTAFVDLSMVRDPGLVLERIGNAVGAGGRPDQAIGQRRMLLVLDNFEQVIEAAGSIAELIGACSNLTLIVTSRVPLRIGAERQLEVPPLDGSDAAELFVDRAAAAVAAEALPAGLVREIVDRLEGLPLAVELAAARTKVLAITAIRDLLVDQMRLLGGGRRDAPDRHRTLRETIGWSYEMLQPGTQRMLRNLSVLAPGFDIHAALEVGGGSLDALAELIDHSLIRRTGDRYSMLETIRAFAEEAAGDDEAAAARARQVRHYAALVRGAPLQPGDASDPEGNDAWLEVCAANAENLRLAFEHAAATSSTEAVVELYLRVGLYWALLGTTEEVARWTRIALESVQEGRTIDLERVRMVAAESARWTGDLRLALGLLGLVLESATARGDRSWMSRTLLFMALSHAGLEEYDEAWARLDQANQLHRAEARCTPAHREHLLHVEIQVLLHQDRVAEADARLEAFLEAHEAGPGWRLRVIEAELLRAGVGAAVGRRDEARALFSRVVGATAGLAFRGTLAEALDGLAGLDRGDRPAIAARLIGMADRIRTESRAVPFNGPQRAALVAHLRGVLGPDAFATARRAGQAFTITEIAAAAVAGPAEALSSPRA